MPEPSRTVIDRVDWKSVLPVLRLVSAFNHALQPGKLMVALLAVLAIHLSGTVLDMIWGSGDSAGIYASLSSALGQQLGGLFEAILSLDVGFSSASGGVIGSLYGIFIMTPQWIFSEHPWFTLLFGLDVLFVLAITCGILTRMSASQVCLNQLTPLGSAATNVSKRWVWYLLTPLMPALLVVVIGAVHALVGLVFFNVPGLDVVGSLLYGLFLLLGFIVAGVMLLLLLALFLMPAALSVEGSDGFDAIARSFNYVLFRPWQFAAYLFASIFYLSIVSVLIGTVAMLTIDVTSSLIELGAFGEGRSRHEKILSGYEGDGGTIGINAWIVARWIELVGAIVAAILLSTFCCLQTQVYVLMRRSADGTPMDQYDGGEEASLWAEEAPAAEQAEQADSTDDTAKAEG
jgi:hypothetical protein